MSDCTPNYEDLLCSYSKEIMAVKDRVRYLIQDTHWGEEGRYKEVILSETLRSFLPQRYGVGTGFVICDNKNGDDEISSQIDIIIYDKIKPQSNAELLKKGDFVIVESQSVEAIIEVKSTFDNKIFDKGKDGKKKNAIEKLLDNKAKIGNRIFAGLFAFETKYDINTIYERCKNENSFKTKYRENKAFINCISFNTNCFLKFWNKGIWNESDRDYSKHSNKAHYSFYEFNNDLGFGYFISNLREHLKMKITRKGLSKAEEKRMFPDKNKNGKEFYLKGEPLLLQ